jgi:energy-coupling factor transporter ATP-binding protein EcfA2
MKKNREVVLIAGRTGTGKSTLARSLYGLWDRRIIFDPQREHARSEATRVHAFAPFHVCLYNAEDAARLALDAGNCVLVLDDAYAFIRHPLPDTIKEVVNGGRHRGVSIIAIIQRLPDVSPDVRAQADVFVSFKAVMESDIDKLDKDWGFNPDVIRSLQEREYRVNFYSDRALRCRRVLSK